MNFQSLPENLRQMLVQVIESKTEAELFGQALFLRTVTSGEKLLLFTEAFLSSPCGEGWDKKRVFESVGYSKAHGYKLLKIGGNADQTEAYTNAVLAAGKNPTVDGFIRWIKTGTIDAAAAAADTDTDTDTVSDTDTDTDTVSDTVSDTDAAAVILTVKFDTRPLGGNLNVTFSVDKTGRVTGDIPTIVLPALIEMLEDLSPTGQSHP